MIRRALILLAFVPCGLGVMSACSEPTRYRVLSFFFDGVPVPGSEAALDDERVSDAPGRVDKVVAPLTPAVEMYPHRPFAQGKCGSCHNPQTGDLVKSLDDGLCQMCHAIPGRARYVHGPVATGDCSFCHHHHTAPHAKNLLHAPPSLCFECHDADELAEGEHHEATGWEGCVTCHDPHGGSDRFFLKRAQS